MTYYMGPYGYKLAVILTIDHDSRGVYLKIVRRAINT